MKKDIHPKSKKLKIKIGSEGDFLEFFVLSTAQQDELLVDVDFRKHPAWTGKGVSSALHTNKNVKAFNKKFEGLTFG